MPAGDSTGPDGKGPKKENKGIPSKDGSGQGKGCEQGKKCGQGKGRCQGIGKGKSRVI